jgi:hypothetical protein
MVNIYTFILAITFHMFMEGFLFGAQTKVLSLSSLFFGEFCWEIVDINSGVEEAGSAADSSFFGRGDSIVCV